MLRPNNAGPNVDPVTPTPDPDPTDDGDNTGTTDPLNP